MSQPKQMAHLQIHYSEVTAAYLQIRGQNLVKSSSKEGDLLTNLEEDVKEKVESQLTHPELPS